MFHYVLAGLSALFSLFPLVYVGLGNAMLSGALEGSHGGPPPPRAFGRIMVAVGTAFTLAGAIYVVLVAPARQFIARRHHWAFCIVMAGLSCAFLPLRHRPRRVHDRRALQNRCESGVRGGAISRSAPPPTTGPA
jgi:hypothetical protein